MRTQLLQPSRYRRLLVVVLLILFATTLVSPTYAVSGLIGLARSMQQLLQMKPPDAPTSASGARTTRPESAARTELAYGADPGAPVELGETFGLDDGEFIGLMMDLESLADLSNPAFANATKAGSVPAGSGNSVVSRAGAARGGSAGASGASSAGGGSSVSSLDDGIVPNIPALVQEASSDAEAGGEDTRSGDVALQKVMAQVESHGTASDRHDSDPPLFVRNSGAPASSASQPSGTVGANSGGFDRPLDSDGAPGSDMVGEPSSSLSAPQSIVKVPESTEPADTATSPAAAALARDLAAPPRGGDAAALDAPAATPEPPIAIPEPSSLALLTLGWCAMARRRHRRRE